MFWIYRTGLYWLASYFLLSVYPQIIQIFGTDFNVNHSHSRNKTKCMDSGTLWCVYHYVLSVYKIVPLLVSVFLYHSLTCLITELLSVVSTSSEDWRHTNKQTVSHLAGSALCTSPYTNNILSGCENSNPAEHLRLTGMFLQRTSPDTNASGG